VTEDGFSFFVVVLLVVSWFINMFLLLLCYILFLWYCAKSLAEKSSTKWLCVKRDIVVAELNQTNVAEMVPQMLLNVRCCFLLDIAEHQWWGTAYGCYIHSL